MKNYMMPPIPNGFTHFSGTWNKGFIIEDSKKENYFTWTPLGILPEIHNYLENLEKTTECYKVDFYIIRNMINKYGGLYISTYPALKEFPNTYMSKIIFKKARVEAMFMKRRFSNSQIHTHLIYAWEYDKIVECIAYLAHNDIKAFVTNEQFKEYGLYGINDIWTWTLTRHSEFSMVIKKGNPSEYETEIYANNEWFESEEVGFRVMLKILE